MYYDFNRRPGLIENNKWDLRFGEDMSVDQGFRGRGKLMTYILLFIISPIEQPN